MEKIKIYESTIKDKDFVIAGEVAEVDSSEDAIETMKRIAKIGECYFACFNIEGDKIFYRKLSEKGSILGVIR